ncbi:MAG: hypothetical protein BMS9Abin02_0542 [Anaerolineae bacterium]|nr:MAG: hypothetical protein BMS9Abin02_0542 [Anaerolineae bacterium]
MRITGWIVIPIVILVGITGFFTVRAIRGEADMEQVVLCPGPDGYGYVCSSIRELEYINATHDIQLFGDDVLAEVLLPFTFIFYGQSYNSLYVSTNGNLQFNQANAAYENECLYPDPAAGLGDLIAPYWDDLDLTFFGFIGTEVVGDEPNRTFIVEWDEAPSFDNADERVTFEVQLTEGSNNIAFLYENIDRVEGDRGSSATIGIQSEQAGYALQFGCNQRVLNNDLRLLFEHPTESAGDLLRGAERQETFPQRALKGNAALLKSILNDKGLAGLQGLSSYWGSQHVSRNNQWMLIDNQENEKELVTFWHGPKGSPERLEVVIFNQRGGDSWQFVNMLYPFAREIELGDISIIAKRDITADGISDILLRSDVDGRLRVISSDKGNWKVYTVPLRCLGQTALIDQDSNGVGEIARDGCPAYGRVITSWSGEKFVID